MINIKPITYRKQSGHTTSPWSIIVFLYIINKLFLLYSNNSHEFCCTYAYKMYIFRFRNELIKFFKNEIPEIVLTSPRRDASIKLYTEYYIIQTPIIADDAFDGCDR